jgi:cytochrome c oxidase subunit 1
MTLMRLPLDGVGHLHCDRHGAAGLSSPVRRAVMMLFDRLLGTSFFMPAIVEMGEQLKYSGGSPILFQHCSGSSATRKSISWRCRPSASSPT